MPRDEIQADYEAGEIEAALTHCRTLISQALAGTDGEQLYHHGDELVVAFRDPSDAINAALRMQRMVEEHSDELDLSTPILLGAGVHHASPGDARVGTDGSVDESWLYKTGLRVASSFCEMTRSTPGIFISGDTHDAVKGKRGLGFRDFGSRVVEGEPTPIDVYQVFPGGSAGDVIGTLAGFVSGSLDKAAVVLLVAAVVVLGVFLLSDFDWDSFQLPQMAEEPELESIAVLPFEGHMISTGGETYRDSLPANLIDALGRYEGLRVVSRAESFALRGQDEDVAAVGRKLDVEGVVTGFAGTSGDWLLARAAVTRTSNGEEIWSRSYYRRSAESASILADMADSMAKALRLEGSGGEGTAVADIGVAGATGAASASDADEVQLVKARMDLEDALMQVQELDVSESEKIASLESLASLYYDTGRDDEAIVLYKRVLDARMRELGPNHPQVAVSMNNLAAVYVSQHNYDDAEPLLERSLQIRQATLGQRHPRVGNALSNLASLYHRQGRLEDAEKTYARALTIRERELGLLAPSDGTADLNDKAAAAQLNGQYDMAQKYYQEALDNEFEKAGTTDPKTAIATRNLAVVRGVRGDAPQSISLFEHALSIFTGSLGEEHPEVARTKAALAEQHRRSGRFADARKYHEESLNTFENSYGENHPEVASALGYLVTVFEAQGLKDEARSARNRQNRIRSSYLGPVFSYASARSSSHGVARDRVQDRLQAPQLMHEYNVMAGQERSVLEKRRVAENLHNMALLYVDQLRYAQAEEFSKRALEIRQTIFERDHPELAMSQFSLGEVYSHQGRYREGELRFKEALRIFQATVGKVHPHVAACWESLAELARRSENRVGDEKYAAQRAKEIRRALVVAAVPPEPEAPQEAL
jgi:tetratricopeptide (TPR) repeat protein